MCPGSTLKACGRYGRVGHIADGRGIVKLVLAAKGFRRPLRVVDIADDIGRVKGHLEGTGRAVLNDGLWAI